MVDERRRTLERDLSAGAGPEVEGRLLVERLRRGDARPDGLELAAYLGSAAAAVALGERPREAPPDPAEWALGLSRFGKPVAVRGAVAAARLVLPHLERTFAGELAPRRAVLAAEAWLACPCEAHRVEARLAAEDANRASLSVIRADVECELEDDDLRDEVVFVALAAGRAADVAAELREDHVAGRLLATLEEAAAALTGGAAAEERRAVVRAAVTRELVAWALAAPGGGGAAPTT